MVGWPMAGSWGVDQILSYSKPLVLCVPLLKGYVGRGEDRVQLWRFFISDVRYTCGTALRRETSGVRMC